MYSMSTETLETEPVFRNGDVYFLPLANGVVYEFIKADSDDSAGNLLAPDQLRPGKTYAMVVSDAHGLRRYQTDDLFDCRQTLNHLPDLAFFRRRALEYSFAGEKLTAEQLTIAFTHLQIFHPGKCAGGFFSCMPSLLPRPHYKLVFIGVSNNSLAGDFLATECDNVLSILNCEYKNKRASGVLGPIVFVQSDAAEFAKRCGGNWESQFKFLPLYRRTWESTNVPHLNASNIPLSDTNTRALTQTTCIQ